MSLFFLFSYTFNNGNVARKDLNAQGTSWNKRHAGNVTNSAGNTSFISPSETSSTKAILDSNFSHNEENSRVYNLLFCWPFCSGALVFSPIVRQESIVFKFKFTTKYVKRPSAYYSNSSASFHCVLVGDLTFKLNPGPTNNASISTSYRNCSSRSSNSVNIRSKHCSAPMCSLCDKTVKRCQIRFVCNTCKDFTHARCTQVSAACINNMRSGTLYSWTCPKCTLCELPFYNQQLLDQTSDSSEPVLTSPGNETQIPRSDEIVNILKEKERQLRIMHLNTQSMVSTFNEFALPANYPLDIITLSETWLKDHRELLEYVSIPGYQTEFLHRKAIKGGGVGAYVRENIKYKRRKDIEEKQPNLEHLWLELPGRNKHSKLLLGVMYRSDKTLRPLDWLDCLEDLLSHITTSWDGMTVLTGDMNIDLLGDFNSVTSRYCGMLDIFGLKQVVSKPTRVLTNTY